MISVSDFIQLQREHPDAEQHNHGKHEFFETVGIQKPPHPDAERHFKSLLWLPDRRMPLVKGLTVSWCQKTTTMIRPQFVFPVLRLSFLPCTEKPLQTKQKSQDTNPSTFITETTFLYVFKIQSLRVSLIPTWKGYCGTGVIFCIEKGAQIY